jgi:hypothetical protein
MKHFWTILVEGTDGGQGHQHATEQDARVEANRLARLHQNKGKKVYIMLSVACCHTPPEVEWEEIGGDLRDGLPF